MEKKVVYNPKGGKIKLDGKGVFTPYTDKAKASKNTKRKKK